MRIRALERFYLENPEKMEQALKTTGDTRRDIMKAIVRFEITMLVVLALMGCGASQEAMKKEQVNPSILIKPSEPIAIMPFETESALSNLGGQVSDEVIVNLLEHAPRMKIIPATFVRNYLLSNNLGVSGIPDMHTIHNLKEGLKCRYLLTGNLYTSIGEVKYTNTYSNRIASGSVTVRLVDCDSMNVLWAKHVESTYSATTYYYSGGQQQTTYYTDGQLMQRLLSRLAYEVARHFYSHE
jgi:TolB-like protein